MKEQDMRLRRCWLGNDSSIRI